MRTTDVFIGLVKQKEKALKRKTLYWPLTLYYFFNLMKNKMACYKSIDLKFINLFQTGTAFFSPGKHRDIYNLPISCRRNKKETLA